MSNSFDSFLDGSKKDFSLQSLEVKIGDCYSLIYPSVPSVSFYITNSKLSDSKNIIWLYLNKLGLYESDESSHNVLMSDICTEGEFRRIFCENDELPKVPILKFKQIWKILREKEIYEDLTNVILNNEEDKISSEELLKKINKKEYDDVGDFSISDEDYERYHSVAGRSELKDGDLKEKSPEEKRELRKKQIEENRIKNGTDSTQVIEILKAIKETNKPIGQWSDEELLSSYNSTCNSEISDILSKRSQNKPFVIFSNENDNTVDIENSLKMLKQARKGITPNTYRVGEHLKRLYRVGVFPAEITYECPLHPSVILLDDGYCDECGLTWNLSQYEVMQFARIIYENKEAPRNGPELRLFVQKCNSGDIQYLKDNYSKSAMIFDERKNDDNLPKLKRRVSIDTRLVSDPMNINRKY